MLAKMPPWIRVKGADEKVLSRMKEKLDALNLHTVCESAVCPNVGSCFKRGTATLMILGDICTRNCGFCGVKHGTPHPPDPDEPRRVAEAARELNLRHVVVTSVTRDDLKDGGASAFADTTRWINQLLPDATTDLLIPDLHGLKENVAKVVEVPPDILAHNLETVSRLYPLARKQADYQRSLSVLRIAKEINSKIYTKSGIMVGLGESFNEVLEVMEDLRGVDCDFLTIGQYLKPAAENIPVKEFVHPEMFERFKTVGEEMGFRYVASAPFVRSSFHAEEALHHLKVKELPSLTV
jgi:lipoic acid synthetase